MKGIKSCNKDVLKEFNIPIIFEAKGTIRVTAENLETAIEFADKHPELFFIAANQLPEKVENLEYIVGTWQAEDDITHILEVNSVIGNDLLELDQDIKLQA